MANDKSHKAVLHGLCSVCGHYGDDCTGFPELSPAERLRGNRLLAHVQQQQTEFWGALRDLEQFLNEVRGAPLLRVEATLDDSTEFNFLDLDDVLTGKAEEDED